MTQQATFLPPAKTDYSIEDFVTSPANEKAVQWLERWPDWPTHALMIYGPTGCGKTYLAHLWAAQTGATFLTARDIYRFDTERLKEGNRCFVIDDIEKLGDEVAFLHFFNTIKEWQGWLLLTAKHIPARLPVRLPDLRSRLNAIACAAVVAPDDTILRAILTKRFADRQLRVEKEVIDYILTRMERSFAAALDTVQLLDTRSLEEHRNITIPFVKEVWEREMLSLTLRESPENSQLA